MPGQQDRHQSHDVREYKVVLMNTGLMLHISDIGQKRPLFVIMSTLSYE